MPETAPGGAALPPSHVSAAQWQSFEMRMRQRRAARLRLRAEAALVEGRVADAAAALEEASTLDSSTPDLETLQAQVVGSLDPASVADLHPSADHEIETVEAEVHRPARRFVLPLAAAAAFLLVSVGVSFVRGTPQPLPTPAAGSVPPAAEPPVATTGNAARATATSVEPPASGAAAEPAPAPMALPPLAPVAPSASSTMAPPASTASIAAEPVSPKLESAVPPPPAIVDPAPAARAELPTPGLTAESLRPEPVAEPPARPTIEPSAPNVADAPSPAALTLPEPAPERVDETPLVKRVLAQYAAAYSSLDASAAKRVWPAVDGRALSRAFAGLESQRISLGQCSVNVEGNGARADCRGSAQWTPKIGGGPQSQPRHWSFDLRKANGDWRIVDATVR